MTRKTLVLMALAAVVTAAMPLLGQMAAASMEPAETAPLVAAPDASITLEPPRLDGSSLADTRWQLTFKGMVLTVSLLPGGRLRVENPGLARLFHTSSVEGTWFAEGAELHVRADLLGKEYALTAVISGDGILVEGRPAQRMQ